MRFLIFSVVAFMTFACVSDYRGMKATALDGGCLSRLNPPAISTAWFDAGIDVVGKHISGLLLVKKMPDASTRVVFTSEAGVSFFDFGFAHDGSFKVHQIIPQLDKKAVVQLLRDDFNLLLGFPFNNPVWQSWQLGHEQYVGVEDNRERYFLVTDAGCTRVNRLESGTSRKRKLTIEMKGSDLTTPESIDLKHHTFAMDIHLRKIDR